MELKRQKTGAPSWRYVILLMGLKMGVFTRQHDILTYNAFTFLKLLTLQLQCYKAFTILHIKLCFSPKDAQKAIKKKLVSNVGKNYTVVMYTLTVRVGHFDA